MNKDFIMEGGSVTYRTPRRNRQQNEIQQSRMNSVKNIGVIIEKVINHTSKKEKSDLQLGNYGGANQFGNVAVANQFGNVSIVNDHATSNQTLQKVSTPPRKSMIESPSTKSNQIEFIGGPTSLLFSATKQQLYPDNLESSAHKQLQSPDKSAGSPIQQTSQITVQINNDGSQSPKQVQQAAQVTASLLKKSTLSMYSPHRSTPQDQFKDEQSLHQTTSANISKIRDRTNKNVTPSTIYNPIATGSVTEGSFNANTTYHQAPCFRPTLSPIPVETYRYMPMEMQNQTQTSSNIGGLSSKLNEPKQVQNMMVRMLKQQVKKRRQFERGGHMLPEITSEGDTTIDQQNEKCCQTPPDGQRSQLFLQDTRDKKPISQQIVFNMMSPRQPARQIYVTTTVPIKDIKDLDNDKPGSRRPPISPMALNVNQTGGTARSSTLITRRSRNKWSELSQQHLSTVLRQKSVMPDGTKRQSITALNSIPALNTPSSTRVGFSGNNGRLLHQLLQEPASKEEQDRGLRATKMRQMQNQRINQGSKTRRKKQSKEASQIKKQASADALEAQQPKTMQQVHILNQQPLLNQYQNYHQQLQQPNYIEESYADLPKSRNQSSRKLSFGDNGIEIDSPGALELSPHYPKSLKMLDKDILLQTTSSADALKDQNNSRTKLDVQMPKKKDAYVVYRHDMSLLQSRKFQQNGSDEQQSQAAGNFNLQASGQTLEKSSMNDHNLNSRKGTLSKVAAAQNEAQSSQKALVSLNDYSWPKGVASPSVGFDVQIGNHQNPANGTYDSKKLPVILSQNRKANNDDLVGSPRMAPVSQGVKDNVTARRNRNVFSTQSELHLPSATKNPQKVGLGFEGQVSYRATLKQKESESALSSSSQPKETGESAPEKENAKNAFLPPLVIDEQPSFFDHAMAVDQQSFTTTNSQLNLLKSQHARMIPDNPSVISLLNKMQKMSIGQNSEEFQIWKELQKTYAERNIKLSTARANEEQMRLQQQLLSENRGRSEASRVSFEHAAVAGKCTQFILKQMMHQKHRSSAKGLYQSYTSRQDMLERQNKQSAAQIDSTLRLNKVNTSPLTSLKHYYEQKEHEHSQDQLQSSNPPPPSIEPLNKLQIIEEQHDNLAASIESYKQENAASEQSTAVLVVSEQLATFSPPDEVEDAAEKDEEKQESKPNVDDLDHSMIFTLGKKQAAASSTRHSKWERYTFTNLDKLAPQNSYNIPVSPSSLDKLPQQQSAQQQTKPEEIFPKKAPIMSLIEVNGKIPKVSPRAESQDTSRLNNSSNPESSYLYNLSRLLDQRGNQDLLLTLLEGCATPYDKQRNHHKSASMTAISQKNQTAATGHHRRAVQKSPLGQQSDEAQEADANQDMISGAGQKKSAPKTRIYLSKINNQTMNSGHASSLLLQSDKQQDSSFKLADNSKTLKLLNYHIQGGQDSKVKEWSPLNSMYSEGLLISQAKSSSVRIDPPLEEVLRSSWQANQSKGQMQLIAAPTGDDYTTSLNLPNKAVPVADPKNMTAKSSDDMTNQDEEYETQYLSQVTRGKGFFEMGEASKGRRATERNTAAGQRPNLQHALGANAAANPTSAEAVIEDFMNDLNEREQLGMLDDNGDDKSVPTDLNLVQQHNSQSLKNQHSSSSNQSQQHVDERQLAKRLQDIAWQIKHHKRIQPFNEGDTNSIMSNNARNTSTKFQMVEPAAVDKRTSTMTKLQIESKGLPYNKSTPQNSGLVSSKGSRRSSPTKQFKSIHIQNWDGNSLSFKNNQ